VPLDVEPPAAKEATHRREETPIVVHVTGGAAQARAQREPSLQQPVGPHLPSRLVVGVLEDIGLDGRVVVE
jgi:hypothetical protein